MSGGAGGEYAGPDLAPGRGRLWVYEKNIVERLSGAASFLRQFGAIESLYGIDHSVHCKAIVNV